MQYLLEKLRTQWGAVLVFVGCLIYSLILTLGATGELTVLKEMKHFFFTAAAVTLLSEFWKKGGWVYISLPISALPGSMS